MSTPAIGQRRELLARAEELVTRRRQAEVDDLLVLLAWADSHDGDPQAEPDPVPAGRGGPRLVQVGGQGTPDALDLRHRLPRVWAQVQDLAGEAWVARKVARMSRRLSREAVTVVDQAVADAIGQAPSRLLAIAEAKVIEADQAAHQARIQENQRRTGVWFPEPRPGAAVDGVDSTAGVRSVFGRLDEADAIELDQAIEDLADLLAERGAYHSDDQPTWDQLRAESLGLLARPADALALLTGEDPDAGDDQPAGEGPSAADQSTDEDPDAGDQCAGGPAADGSSDAAEERSTSRPRQRRRATLVAHLSDLTLFGAVSGVARVEGIGPMLLEQLAALLGHRDIEVLPVIDLHESRAVNGYEHPTDVRTRTALRTLGDVFPHSAARPEARVDHDHPTPYDPTGPPGQTGDHNDAPLTRRHHRAKTYLGYQADQLAPGVYRWATPHGLGRIVTPAGTRTIKPLTTSTGQIIGEFYPTTAA